MAGPAVRVLLVEDSPSDAQLIRHELGQAEGCSFEVALAGRVDEAIAKLCEEPFDVALLDLSLPDSTGISTFTRIQAKCPQVPIVVLTGGTNEEIGTEAIRRGAQDYLVKGRADGKTIVRAIRYAIERQRAEESLREAHRRMSVMLESITDCYFAFDREWRFTQMNRNAEMYFGVEAGQLLERVYWEVFPQVADSQFDTEYRRAMNESVAVHFESPTYVMPGRWVDVHVYPSSDGLFIFFREITERKQAEAAMARYQLISQYARDPLLLIGLDGKIVEANHAAVDLYGHPYEDLMRLNIQDLRLQDDPEKVRRQMRQALRQGILFETVHKRKDGSSVSVEVNSRGVSVEGQDMLLSVVRDITERKQAEEALRKAHAELELRVQERTAELSQAVGDLEGEVARRALAERQLRDANKSLRQRAEQLRSLASELTLAEQRERRRIAEVLHDGLQQLLVGAKFRLGMLQRKANKEAQEAASAVEDLLVQSIDLSRSLSRDLSPPVLHEGGLIPALEWLVRWMNEKHGFAVDLVIENEVAVDIEDLRVLLFQCVRELLLNAVKHANVRSARVRLNQVVGQARIVVEDEGVGFDAAPFSERTAGSGGFGLFSISERLDLMGGQMEIESARGKGSRFTLLVPIPPAEAQEGEKPRPKLGKRATEQLRASSHETRKRIRVLLADDHPFARQAVAEALQREPDVEIVGQATDGESAIALAKELLPEVVVMDINMPAMNGIESTRRIHAALPEIRIIGLSMSEGPEGPAALREAGAATYLSKSGSIEALLAAIRG